MTKFTITESEKNRILKMHNILNEQTSTFGTSNDPEFIKFADAVEKNFKGAKRDQIFPSKDGKRYWIKIVSNKGTTFYFYSDMTVVSGDGKIKKTYYWPNQTTTAGTTTAGTTTAGTTTAGTTTAGTSQPKFTQSNLDALEELKKQGFYYMPNPPSQFKVDQGEYVKLDITGKDQKNPAEYVNLVTNFSKYFPEFKESLYVYKSTPQEKTAGRGEKVEVTKESCQTAVFELERLIDEPNSFSLTNDQIVGHIQTAKRCQDKGNKLGLLNLRYNKAFKKIKDRYFKYN